MAIFHLHMKPICRGDGKSAIAAAAYRAGGRLIDRRTGRAHDYRGRADVEHAAVVLPSGVRADWAIDRGQLWNAAEAAEKRRDARTAREFEVALPAEWPASERRGAVLEFARWLADRYGVAVDVACHQPRAGGDSRNFHAHLLATTRTVTDAGFARKGDLELSDRQLTAAGLPRARDQLVAIRAEWERIVNARLARTRSPVRVDRRSHCDRQLEFAPSRHVGAGATGVERRGIAALREAQRATTARRNADLIVQTPRLVLGIIAAERRVCGRRVIATMLTRYVGKDHRLLRRAHEAVMHAHWESEVARIMKTVADMADRRRHLLAAGERIGLQVFDQQTTAFREGLRRTRQREPVLDALLRGLMEAMQGGAPDHQRVEPPDPMDGGFRI